MKTSIPVSPCPHPSADFHTEGTLIYGESAPEPRTLTDPSVAPLPLFDSRGRLLCSCPSCGKDHAMPCPVSDAPVPCLPPFRSLPSADLVRDFHGKRLVDYLVECVVWVLQNKN